MIVQLKMCYMSAVAPTKVYRLKNEKKKKTVNYVNYSEINIISIEQTNM